jgi:pimeloyl-ACP methyl ester carboxylesterase
MKEIYLLSGLGADKRIFELLDLSDFKVNHVAWIEPTDNETIQSYAQRLLNQITTDRPTIIGVSFGGIMTIEIARLIETEKLILISSAKTRNDLPIYYRLVGQLGINKIIPAWILKNANPLTYWFFGTKTKKQKDLLKEILKETDDKFLKWAIDKIVNWENVTELKNVKTIHGTADRILPFKTADFKINNGGHLMIIDKSDLLNGALKQLR